MSRNIDINAVCPYFTEEPSGGSRKLHELLTKTRIRCEGLTPGGKIFLEFPNAASKQEHLEDFCYCDCWQGCPIALMLNEKYEGRG